MRNVSGAELVPRLRGQTLDTRRSTLSVGLMGKTQHMGMAQDFLVEENAKFRHTG